MKIDVPPPFQIRTDYLQRIWTGEFDEAIARSDERYYFWEDIKYRNDLPFENPIDNWNLIKTYRTSKYEYIQFGHFKFSYFISPFIAKNIHEFDLKLIGGLQAAPLQFAEGLDYLKNSVLEEAVASSQVEGASTTTEQAREMLKTGRSPRNESEQMIFNNLRAIRYIEEFQNSPLDSARIIELHRIMTANTSAGKFSGNFRTGNVFVTDHVDGEVAHVPPTWEEVEFLMARLCEFANDDSRFIHPIVKASILHFMVGFIHPFMDGNGRTARALFYWYLLKKGYTLIKNISISRVILESRTQYDTAFLKTETDDHDLNYFIAYSVKNIRVAFEKLRLYRDRKLEERKKAGFIAYLAMKKGLNKRQAEVLGQLYGKETGTLTLRAYADSHQVVRQTATKDLRELLDLGLLLEDKSTKPYTYRLKSRSGVDHYLG